MPKIRIHQRTITRECRQNHGDFGACEEAIATVRRNIDKLLRTWPEDSGAKVYVTVEVEYPDQGEEVA